MNLLFIYEIYNLEKEENWIEIRNDFIDEFDKIRRKIIRNVIIMQSPI